jgi:Ribbon-helix-helix protein, copG family
MPVTISARVPPATAELLRHRAAEEERTVSDLVSRAVDEYLRSARFPGVVFVTGGSGRRKARLLNGMDVWEIVFTARRYENDADATASYLGVPVSDVRLALAYYAAYPAEIDAILRRLDEADADPLRLHPGVRLVET